MYVCVCAGKSIFKMQHTYLSEYCAQHRNMDIIVIIITGIIITKVRIHVTLSEQLQVDFIRNLIRNDAVVVINASIK